MDEALMTVSDCSRLAANSEAFWRKAIFRRLIPVVRIGRSVRIRRQDFDAFLKAAIRPALPRHGRASGHASDNEPSEE